MAQTFEEAVAAATTDCPSLSDKLARINFQSGGLGLYSVSGKQLVMVETEELIVAIFGVAFVVVIFMQFKSLQMRELKIFFVGAILLLSAAVFTILEGVLWREVFNFMEHLSYASAGICFAVGCSILGRWFREEQDGQL